MRAGQPAALRARRNAWWNPSGVINGDRRAKQRRAAGVARSGVPARARGAAIEEGVTGTTKRIARRRVERGGEMAPIHSGECAS